MKLFIIALVSFGVMCAMGMRYKPTSLQHKICSAQVIAVGKITGIRKQYMSITSERDKKPYETYYDLGYIHNAGILKTDRKIDSELTVLFQSAQQPPSNIFGRTREAYSEGAEGIWRLRRDIFSGSYLIENPEAPMPLSKEDEIKKILSGDDCKGEGLTKG